MSTKMTAKEKESEPEELSTFQIKLKSLGEIIFMKDLEIIELHSKIEDLAKKNKELVMKLQQQESDLTALIENTPKKNS